MFSSITRALNNLHWFIDNTEYKNEARNRRQGRRLVLEAIEAGGNNYLIVAVAGLGFFTDSYILFASNAISPMLAYTYWNEAKEASHDLALNLATLGGCVVGQLLFGWLADRRGMGRRKVYGWELLLLMAGTTGVVMSSPGYALPVGSQSDANGIEWSSYGSMNVIAWLVWWRFVTGVGIGGDYPVSATLVSEMAPTKRRARMLAAMFSMQAVGYAAANIVALVVTIIVRHYHPDPTPRSIDQIWRWVIGLSLIPAFIASLLRLTIPESPRYTLDVTDNISKAFDESTRFNNAKLQQPEWVTQANQNTNSAALAQDEDGNVSGGEETELIDVIDINQSKIEAKRYFLDDGNWRLIAGTALCWFLLDIGFFALSLNSPRLVSKLWYQNPQQPAGDKLWATNPTVEDPEKGIYTILITNNTHSLIISSIGALTGSAAMLYFIDKINRRKFQLGSFLVLAALFIITGATFQYTVQTSFHGVTIILFVLCVFVFYCGPNTLTFLIPAELFPTKYRATCHGISAAAGKIGSIITQVFIAYVTFDNGGTGETSSLDPQSKWLGWILLIFSLPMVLGAFVTWWLIPDVQDSNRKPKTLEELVFVRQMAGRSSQDVEMSRKDRSSV
ncbi:hypothetical protein H2198_009430 [Neophaeococcomyces mojaviensis]|uniref:Uncharacterized protein n=1 Tax=Neophaeococcomyces mojaviensis TaxID=3383035 RepID=A0ACC2ZUT1_9EURO|nr:hypothetical protein H2198_009430 [Knufia sp. JES_112]